ncbi:O-fucosyltransferase family protein [Bacillus cytotoxicus]|uniref:Glycosyltransferase GT-D fold domain-containing protein n=1 Tax=Bacillus cytotoxicus TaxID=580165 RepID=A0AAX2CDV1_9BACI|nr:MULTISPECIES: O-fucosyltransferase family protein [Bacillus cereus group]MDH2879857.1 O-fucosyltransferase family protein [Bacillus cytotoxicus]QTR71939.1 O-fucosyltransferase family protein [Bacillus cytotoxicus]QTR83105.1 O-fucosyltransferase family protein [Bacillus cytotoxicus]QTR86842.1 O-fucosyltransferase family protein [Bacillus cytotoxicus]SCL86461.1 Uncharacterized protein BCB44BAC_00939 [Bacillus cytotoxicus]
MQYEIGEIEGLCNQLMAIFRTIGEALYYAKQHDAVCILLKDVQTRNSVDFHKSPYFSKINIDSYLDVDECRALFYKKNILVKRHQPDMDETFKHMITCRRFLQRHILRDESRETGQFIAKSLPFAKHIQKLASCTIGLMSFYPRWRAIQLRIEGDLVHLPVEGFDLAAHTENQLQQIINTIASTADLSAVYIASGVQEEKYHRIVARIKEHFPHLVIVRKQDVLQTYPGLQKELDALCLEEQALVDWLVCIGAPLFAGPHASSFSYLAGYMRHYRGFDKETTYLWPEYQPYWDQWFPRL